MVWDGNNIKSVDPDGKPGPLLQTVSTVEVAAAGKSLDLPKDSIDIGAKDVGFGQPLTKDAHVIVRPGVGTMPDGSGRPRCISEHT